MSARRRLLSDERASLNLHGSRPDPARALSGTRGAGMTSVEVAGACLPRSMSAPPLYERLPLGELTMPAPAARCRRPSAMALSLPKDTSRGRYFITVAVPHFANVGYAASRLTQPTALRGLREESPACAGSYRGP